MNLLILNDVHLGVTRQAGTTPQSAILLRESLRRSLKFTLDANDQHDCLILGDLFDSFEVDVSDLLAAFHIFADWLQEKGKKLHLVQGNHDIAKNSQKVSTFKLLCHLLTKMFPNQVHVYDSGLECLKNDDGHDFVWIIPHVVNQDIFDFYLEEALSLEPAYLLLHANLDNNFAEQSDHSLNVSGEMVQKLLEKRHTLVFAHEHHRRVTHGGEVLVLGNQWPSSVYDCLHGKGSQEDGCKYAHIIRTDENDGCIDVVVERFMTWDGTEDFEEQDWTSLQPTKAHFVRVIGNAKAEQAADVVNAISKYRQQSEAFVVSNAVQIDGIEGMGDLATLSQERLESVDVMGALCEQLTPEEATAVKKLWEGRGQ